MIPGEKLKHHSQMHLMFFIRGVVNQDIIEEYQHKLPKTWAKSSIHGKLECSRGTGETKSHNSKLIVTTMGLKCGFILFTRLDSDLMETWPEVQTREPNGISKLIQKLTYDWYRILPLNGNSIQVTIVHTKVPGTVLLLDQKNR
jgi:hypothetical protein